MARRYHQRPKFEHSIEVFDSDILPLHDQNDEDIADFECIMMRLGKSEKDNKSPKENIAATKPQGTMFSAPQCVMMNGESKIDRARSLIRGVKTTATDHWTKILFMMAFISMMGGIMFFTMFTERPIPTLMVYIKDTDGDRFIQAIETRVTESDFAQIVQAWVPKTTGTITTVGSGWKFIKGLQQLKEAMTNATSATRG